MKQRPILFSAPMVRALLDGSKTQTRRIAKHKGELPPNWATFAQPMSNIQADGSCKSSDLFRWSEEQAEGQPLKSLRRWPGNGADLEHDWHAIPCPYGKQGDQLWVREAWMPDAPRDGTWADVEFYGCKDAPLSLIPDRYRKPEHCLFSSTWAGTPLVGWKPSIHMPRWASRITLEITSIRVERLQVISEQDAMSEGAIGGHGAIPNYQYAATPVEHFKHIWESINGAKSWEANPWVWVIEFKRKDEQ